MPTPARIVWRQPRCRPYQQRCRPRDIVALHGDIHYDNILDSGHRGWLAIDPKGVIGERGFDYANLFCNPTIEVATSPTRLPRAIPMVATRAGLEPQRLLRWIIAWSGLMAAWMLEDAEEPTLPLSVAESATAHLKIFQEIRIFIK